MSKQVTLELQTQTLAYVLACALLVAVSIFAGYIWGQANEKQRSVRTVSGAVKTQSDRDSDLRAHSIETLYVCTLKASDATQKATCYREARAGILPDLTMEDFNLLPDMY